MIYIAIAGLVLASFGLWRQSDPFLTHTEWNISAGCAVLGIALILFSAAACITRALS